MTKAQLITQLASLPDDATVYCAVVPRTSNMDAVIATLRVESAGYGCATIDAAGIYEQDGPDAPAFACIEWSY